jgi:predicted transcriptional regulator
MELLPTQQLRYAHKQEFKKPARRDRGRIVIDILTVLGERERKFTHLLYKTNLSCERLKHYLRELTEKGLVHEHRGVHGTVYQLTEEGFQAHAQYSPFVEFLRNLEA